MRNKIVALLALLFYQISLATGTKVIDPKKRALNHFNRNYFNSSSYKIYYLSSKLAYFWEPAENCSCDFKTEARCTYDLKEDLERIRAARKVEGDKKCNETACETGTIRLHVLCWPGSEHYTPDKEPIR